MPRKESGVAVKQEAVAYCVCGHREEDHLESRSCFAVHHIRSSGEEVYCPCWNFVPVKPGGQGGPRCS